MMHIETPGAHVDQLLRQTRVHHVQLSMMADLKANMMLTAASLVLTFSIRYLAQPVFQWAAATLIVFCLASITCAIYATMPKVPLKGHKKDDPEHKRSDFNLLFFGSFIDLDYENYLDAMDEVCQDTSKVYESMVREVYSLGMFLARRKYRHLRWAYLCFLSGLFTSGLVLTATEVLTALGFQLWHFEFSGVSSVWQ
ncbi:MAG: hypothetical protein HYV26_03190 [Candidatus Hydrogenedentes bacterium]|nr:hypothetical protein [Candidatus Hydrogenedentota bacterium]